MKLSQIEKDKFHLYAESKKQNKQKQTHKYREQGGGFQRREGWGVIGKRELKRQNRTKKELRGSNFKPSWQQASHKNMPLAEDLLYASLEEEKRKHKQQRLVQSSNSYFTDGKCPGCHKITAICNHAQTQQFRALAVLCQLIRKKSKASRRMLLLTEAALKATWIKMSGKPYTYFKLKKKKKYKLPVSKLVLGMKSTA